MTAASRVIDNVGQDIKSVGVEEQAIFGFIQASMVKRFALKRSDCFPVYSAAGEHQGGVRSGMRPENVEHWALIFRARVKEAVPCQDAVKAPAESQRSHIVDDPGLIREARFAEVDESWRRIHASYMATFFDEEPGNRLGRTASKVEDGSSRSQNGEEAVKPWFFKKVASSRSVIVVSVPLIQADNSFRVGVHARNANMTARAAIRRQQPSGSRPSVVETEIPPRVKQSTRCRNDKGISAC